MGPEEAVAGRAELDGAVEALVQAGVLAGVVGVEPLDGDMRAGRAGYGGAVDLALAAAAEILFDAEGHSGGGAMHVLVDLQ